MLYLHFCSFCQRIHILSGHRKQCPACDSALFEVPISYEQYINASLSERDRLKYICQNACLHPRNNIPSNTHSGNNST